METIPEAALREALADADAAVTVFTAERRFLGVNNRYLEITGYTREEALAHRAGETLRLDPLDRAQFLELITAAVSAGEADIVRKDGTTLAVEFVVIPTAIDGERAFFGIMWPLIPGSHVQPPAHAER
jgi:PAS domain S-box-containing protein